MDEDKVPSLFDRVVTDEQLSRIEDDLAHIGSCLYQVKPKGVLETLAVSVHDIVEVVREIRSAR